MKITIDTSVTFDFSGGRSATVDAWEFDEWYHGLWPTKGTKAPLKDENGQVQLDEEGKPREEFILSLQTIRDEMASYFKEKAGIAIKPHEADYLHQHWDDDVERNPDGSIIKENDRPKIREGLFSQKKRNFANREQAPTSPTSPPSTDPRFSE